MAFNVVDGWTVPGFTHERELGGGAFGRVALAVDDTTGTRVAIRYLDRRLIDDPSFMARFGERARTLTQVEDPNVVDVYDFVTAAEGAALVMQHVEGVSLRRVLAVQGPVGPLAALSTLGGMLLGLAAAHDREIVHGAVRPSDVLVDGQGNAVVGDFALAPPGAEAQTAPPYAAPELWEGAPATVATDVYAATAVFFECLTGRPPFAGRNMARLHREGPIPVEEVPGPLRDLLRKGLAKDAAERPASVADFITALEEAAISAYGPSWEAQGRGRLTELAAEAARRPEPKKSSRGTGRNAIVAAGADRPGRGSRTRWIAAGAATLAVIAGAAVAVPMLTGGEDPAPVAAPPTPAQQSTSPQPVLPEGGVDPAPLVARIEQATAQAPGAKFDFARDGEGAVRAKGTFAVVPGALPSYAMTVRGTGETKSAGKTIVVGDRFHGEVSRKWRPLPGNHPYAALTEQVRRGSSVATVTSLLRTATELRKDGDVYKGAAPAAALAQVPNVGPLYASLTRTTGAATVDFAIRLDRLNRPAALWLRAGQAKAKHAVLQTTYADWGGKDVKAPR
ncbi:serine/threonine-protein kinase [Actinomadura sp. WAC 06369]|uniref:serine/threonine-protein kinase n=1 Tax=Actinomadura sp. WAC 06369 TaxID=2203193 RepID=UPI000F789E5C|nr:serine/threonine-protein kinase [Actinomadura sp. WAC 06369]RSN48943.1 serine/threonine protein kinase [Actinomadura sp. WAC 06369]